MSNYKTAFHYRLEKETNMAIDHETNEPCAAYCKIDLDHNKPVDFYSKVHKSYAEILAKQLGVDSKYVVPITKEEYEENNDEE